MVGGGNEDPEDGADIVSTLDLDLQDVAGDKALRHQLTTQNALWGTAIVMEVATGEVLALANLGRNGRGGFSENMNYAIAKRAELGSVFKLATMLALIEDAGMPTETVYDTGNGRPVVVGGARVQDSHAGFNDMDFKTAVARSSNVYFAGGGVRALCRPQRSATRSSCARSTSTARWGSKPTASGLRFFPGDWKKIGGANQALARLSFG